MKSPVVNETIAERIRARDWGALSTHLDSHGWATIDSLLDPDECRAVADLYPDDGRFRSHIARARHGFGRGQYKYFRHRLPQLVADLRSALYPRLAPIANRWNESMGLPVRFPTRHVEFLDRCHRA